MSHDWEDRPGGRAHVRRLRRLSRLVEGCSCHPGSVLPPALRRLRLRGTQGGRGRQGAVSCPCRQHRGHAHPQPRRRCRRSSGVCARGVSSPYRCRNSSTEPEAGIPRTQVRSSLTRSSRRRVSGEVGRGHGQSGEPGPLSVPAHGPVRPVPFGPPLAVSSIHSSKADNHLTVS